jgi:hypothetical protein
MERFVLLTLYHISIFTHAFYICRGELMAIPCVIQSHAGTNLVLIFQFLPRGATVHIVYANILACLFLSNYVVWTLFFVVSQLYFD